jgi:hypothetical protein
MGESENRLAMTMQCKVTDETGSEPVRCEIIWAWVPKKRD